jgi:hypothetical protein
MLPVFEIYLNQSLKCWKFRQKISRIVLDILCTHKVVSRENAILMLCVQKTKFGAKIGVPWDIFLPFLHKTQKMSIFCETWHMHIECQDIRAKFFVQNFLTFWKCFFGWREHMLPYPKWNFQQLVLYNRYQMKIYFMMYLTIHDMFHNAVCFGMLMIYSTKLVKHYIVWLFRKNKTLFIGTEVVWFNIITFLAIVCM